MLPPDGSIFDSFYVWIWQENDAALQVLEDDHQKDDQRRG